MGFVTAPTFQADAAAALDLAPDYEATLLGYEIHDLAHLVRYTRNAKALAWLANDTLAKDDLIHQAEMFHLTYNPHYNSPFGEASMGGGRWDRDYIDERPGSGFRVGRSEGWGIDTMAAAYALASPEWRAAKLPWFGFVTDLLIDGQASCSGFLQANISDKFLDGMYRARQSIEAAILENAIRGMLETVYRGTEDPKAVALQGVLVRSFRAMVSAESWSPGEVGPWTFVAVAPLDESLPPWCGFLPEDGQSAEHDTFQTACSLGYAYELTGDDVFLQKAAEMFGADPLTSLLDDGDENLENRAALLAILQTL